MSPKTKQKRRKQEQINIIDYIKHTSANRIIGDLIGREKYRFVNRQVIASVVDDVMEIVDYYIIAT